MAVVYMTAKELAARWGRSPGHVNRMARRGQIAALSNGKGWRFSQAVVEAYELAHTSGSGSSASNEGREPEAPPSQEVRPPTIVDGFTLPADYEPVFKDLWPGHEATTRKTALRSN